jgi:hypothetical protein
VAAMTAGVSRWENAVMRSIRDRLNKDSIGPPDS